MKSQWMLKLLLGLVIIIITSSIYTYVKINQKTIPEHTCIDPTHITCDGNCVCDGLGCNKATNHLNLKEFTYQLIPVRDYQLEIVEDSLLIYDGMRYVGTISLNKENEIGNLIYEDNH